ncbi:hypothetical protein H109_07274, partial [Trichophyton interdigitale MR816]
RLYSFRIELRSLSYKKGTTKTPNKTITKTPNKTIIKKNNAKDTSNTPNKVITRSSKVVYNINKDIPKDTTKDKALAEREGVAKVSKVDILLNFRVDYKAKIILKDRLISTLVLIYLDFSKLFIVTDYLRHSSDKYAY